jgi:glycosyltransferase involved in cell wall biosynthesis
MRVTHIADLVTDNYYFNRLSDNSDEISFISLKGHNDSSLEKRPVHCLDITSRRNYRQAARQISRILQTEKPDIVHTHLFDASLIGLTVAKRQRLPTVMTRHHSDVIYRIQSRLKRNAYLLLEKFMMRKADRIIAPSQMVRDVMIRQNIPREKITVIPYSQAAERYAVNSNDVRQIKAELGMGNGTRSIVFPSRLDHLKGHRYLFDAMAALIAEGMKLKLYLVGAGPYERELRTMVAEKGLTQYVEFLGFRKDILNVIAASDLLVQPSLSEALSSVTIEAVMLGTPVVATDVGGVRDTLDNGKYGKIVPPADNESLHRAIAETFNDLESARAKTKEGRKYLLNYMDSRRVASAYEEVYKTL